MYTMAIGFIMFGTAMFGIGFLSALYLIFGSSIWWNSDDKPAKT